MRSGVFFGLTMLLVSLASAGEHEHWRLDISGKQQFVFGEPVLFGSVEVPWKSSIQIYVEDGQFVRGFGDSEWIDDVHYYSKPEGWFECHLEQGDFLDRNLKQHSLPWVRYPKFPVAGKLESGVLELVPAFSTPGNYLALVYNCRSENPTANNWFTFAKRGRQENGRRQDFETTEKGDVRTVRVREVKHIGPAMSLTIPLQDGWRFTEGSYDSGYEVSYRLQKVKD